MKSTWNPVVQWLNEVRQSAEIESLSALQAKSVAHRPDTHDALAVRNAQIAVLAVRKNSQDVLGRLHEFVEALPLSLIHIDQFRQRFLELCTPLCNLLEQCRRRCALHEPPQTASMSSTFQNISHSLDSPKKQSNSLAIKNDSESPHNPSETLYDQVCNGSKYVLRLLHAFVQRRQVQNLQLEGALRQLLAQLDGLVQRTVRLECKFIVDTLYGQQHSGLCVKWCLLALWQLTQHDQTLCSLFTSDYPVLKVLVNLISTPNFASSSSFDEDTLLSSNNKTITSSGSINSYQMQLKCAALRVLTHLCSRPEAVLEICSRTAIEQRLIRLLNSPSNGQLLRHECVRLIVQITRILTETRTTANRFGENSKILPQAAYGIEKSTSHITTNQQRMALCEQLVSQLSIDQLVECLTGVLSSTNDRQMFLMTSAAFANLSFADCYAFVRHRTVHVLLSVLENRVANFIDDLPIKDQVLTFLANLADYYPLELLHSGGLIYLISALRHCERGSQETLTEQQFEDTLERVQQKAATALGRLAIHDTLASFIYRFQGIGRLVALCVDSRLRNHSDNVLLAALAALRRAAITLGTHPFEELQRMDLIQLPFREAFTRYAINKELYV